MISPADPDARYNKHKGTGDLVQIMETFVEDDSPNESADNLEQCDTQPSPPDLITPVAVGPLTMHDQDALGPALDDADSRHISPQELLADSHYGSTECVADGEQREGEIVAPAMTAKGTQQGKLTLENFDLDDEGRVLSCPAGHPPVETSLADVRLQVLFDPVVWEACPQKARCPTATVGRPSQRYQDTHDRVQHRVRRLHGASDEFRDRCR